MANGLRLRQARQPDGLAALQTAEPRFHRRCLFEVDAGGFGGANFENQRLLDCEPAIAGEGSGFGHGFRPFRHKILWHLNHEEPRSARP